jgi:hypothetical protein
MLPGLVINGMDSGFCILATSKQHCASADVGHLLKQANLLLDRRGTRTVLRVGTAIADLRTGRSHTLPQQEGGLGFRCQVLECWRARQESNPRPPGS